MSTIAFPKKLNLGLIGCGDRLRTVVKAILKEAPADSLRIAAAYDPDPGSYKALREAFGDGCKSCASEDELVHDPEIDWVFIGSWNCHHARQAILALNAGKHVFCEKPLATTLEDCLAIREAARKSGKTFAFGLVLRYSPHYQRIMEVIRSGAIGKIISFEFNETLSFNHGGYIFGNWRRERRNAGTHLLEKCCHDLDLANWIVGSLPVRVASFGGLNFFKPENAYCVEQIGPKENGDAAYCAWPDPHRCNPFDGKAEIFDNQVAILEYANGVRGTFHTNCNAGLPERRFYICGTEGALRADLITSTLEVRRIGWESKIEKINTEVSDGHGGGDEAMGKAMVGTLLRGEAPLASVDEGIRSALVAFGIDQAADEGLVVDLHALWCRAEIDPKLEEPVL
jgi:predicted dehydrogenase